MPGFTKWPDKHPAGALMRAARSNFERRADEHDTSWVSKSDLRSHFFIASAHALTASGRTKRPCCSFSINILTTGRSEATPNNHTPYLQ